MRGYHRLLQTSQYTGSTIRNITGNYADFPMPSDTIGQVLRAQQRCIYELMGTRARLGIAFDRQGLSLRLVSSMLFARSELSKEEWSTRNIPIAQAHRMPDAVCPQNKLLTTSGMITRKCWSAPDLVSLDARSSVFR
jgi:hypothetical protein